MSYPRSMFDPLTCIRKLNEYIREERRLSRYTTETRVLRFDRDGKVTARETHEPNGREKRNTHTSRKEDAVKVLNVLLPTRAA